MKVTARILAAVWLVVSIAGFLRATRADGTTLQITAAWLAVALVWGTSWFLFAVASRLDFHSRHEG